MKLFNFFNNPFSKCDNSLSSSSKPLYGLDEESKVCNEGHQFNIEHINRFLTLVVGYRYYNWKKKLPRKQLKKIKELKFTIKLVICSGKDEIIQQFLEFDRCYILADKYLLSMVFVYFIRAGLDPCSSYTRLNFFAALYLAHDMEEDDEDLKSCFSLWAFGCKLTDNRLLPQLRCKLWAAMDFRAIVSLKCCHQVMERMKDCELWTRERSEVHGGAIRPYAPKPQCSRCHLPQISFYGTDCESDSSEDSSNVTDSSETWDSDDETCFPTNKKFKFSEE